MTSSPDQKKNVFVRSEIMPAMPPPVLSTGLMGWLNARILFSMRDYSSPGAALKSVLMAIFTLSIFWLSISIVYRLIDFAVLSAVWTDPGGLKRQACLVVENGGIQPSGWSGACWPFVKAKIKILIYGPYDNDHIWRVNLTGALGMIGLVWVMIDTLPYRRYVGLFLLTAYPVMATVLLTGGGFRIDTNTVLIITLLGLFLITIGRLGARGVLPHYFRVNALLMGFSGWSLVGVAVVLGLFKLDLGLTPIDTNDWGGLLITLVVAITGIVASLPVGILLALGRRSKMPLARTLSIIFIEFWRGVPLITVLFMASVMLPLFLPEGVNFNNLLRALLGVMLFSAAYMAEVVRGGLQAIDKGQYEGAEAMGLKYWQTMRLVILPQALTHVIPGIVNTFIGLFKDTTLVSIIGLFDMLGIMRSSLQDPSWASPVQNYTGYLFVAAIFFFFCFGMSRYSMFMERKLNRGH